MKILRANGMTYEDISGLVGVSIGSVSKYVKDVSILPKHMQRNPFSLIGLKNSENLAKTRIPTVENRRIAEEIGDIDYFIEDHEEGTRFEGPLDKIDLKRLQQIMDEPTDYHSTLPINEWMDYYLSGIDNRFLEKPPHLWCKTQYEIFDVWEKYRFAMVETFRGVGKTVAADAIIIHEICENRDNNYAIMSETKNKAAKRIRHVGNVLLTNKRIIADYGFLPHVTKYEGTRAAWKQDEITVKRTFKQVDPTLMAYSTESAESTGTHIAGIIYDDVWSINLQKNSQSNINKWFTWRGEMEGCLEDAWELFILTRKGVRDLYRVLEDSQQYVVIKRPAVKKFPTKWDVKYIEVEGEQFIDRIEVESDDWEITDDGNGRFNIEFFIRKKLKIEIEAFKSEYQLDPISVSGEYFKKRDLRWIRSYHNFFDLVEEKRRAERLRIIGCMDLAFGRSPRADFTALVIIGYYAGRYYLLEIFLKRGALDKDIAEMCRKAFKQFQPFLTTLYIEADLQQSRYVDQLKKQIPFLNIKEVLSRQEQAKIEKAEGKAADLTGKLLRIWAQLEDVVTNNNLYVVESIRNKKEFLDEFVAFPECDHFDVLDALGNGISKMSDRAALLFALSGDKRGNID